MSARPRAFVYVDGLNLYFRALRGTPYKWLNIEALCDRMLPRFDVVKIRYYTARIRSRGDSQRPLRQETYLRALRTLPRVEIHYGKFSVQKVSRELARPSLANRVRRWFGLPQGMNRCVRVYDPKEKGSDVNLAVHVVNDAWHDRYDVAVVLSNDSDLLESLRIVRRERAKRVWVINPHRDPNPELHREADAVRRLSPHHLAESQLPEAIPGTPIHKPSIW